jgi:DNA-binding NtrC family response regulator
MALAKRASLLFRTRRIKVIAISMIKQTKTSKPTIPPPASFSPGSTIVQEGREEQTLINLQPRILIVDSESVTRRQLAVFYTSKGYEVQVANSGEEALSRIQKRDIDLAVINLEISDTKRVELVAEIHQFVDSKVSVIATGHLPVDHIDDDLRYRLDEYVVKPFSLEAIHQATQTALNKAHVFIESTSLRQSLNDTVGEFGLLLSKTPAMHQIFESMRMASPTNMSVVLEGEAGTGKELIASAIHHQSSRRDGPFIPINCAAYPDLLLEAELFGYEEAGRVRVELKRPGKIKLAHRGTLFLDEIENMDPFVQTKLLQVLEDWNTAHLGGHQSLDSDVRIIAASNVPLQELVAQGKMRPDLYYRINVVPIQILPLRERAGDIPLLIEDFLRWHPIANQKRIVGVSRETIARLIQYQWPGNIRELQNVLEKAVVLSKGSVIEDIDLPREHTG